MDYAEHLPPEALRGLVKCFWSLAANGAADEWIVHEAVPDGCIELIRRLDGQSRWSGVQPATFAAGLIEAPVAFEISGDARFAAVRLWPWTWRWLSATPLAAMQGGWRALDEPALRALAGRLDDPAAAATMLAGRLAAAPPDLAGTGRAIAGAGSVAEMQAATGLGPRALQRWFGRHVGLPPRRYLRLLRFQRAFAIPPAAGFADHAARHGFADQAHMAREYRALAGIAPREAGRTSKGPFLR